MSALLLASVFAIRMAGAPQSVEFQAEAGKAYHLAVTSHCSCYKPQPTVVVPEVDLFDAAGNHIALPNMIARGTSRGTADYTLAGEVMFTVPASGTYMVRVSPAAEVHGTFDAIYESFSSSSSGGSRTGVLSSSYGTILTPIAASDHGRVTLTIE